MGQVVLDGDERLSENELMMRVGPKWGLLYGAGGWGRGWGPRIGHGDTDGARLGSNSRGRHGGGREVDMEEKSAI